jgi:hypothetical protein
MERPYGTRKYALVVNGKFACEYRYPSMGNELVERTTAILQSNPKVVITDDSPIDNVNTYNLFIGKELAGQIYFIDKSDLGAPEMINAALKSNPIIIDMTGLDMPLIDDLWDGTTFVTPIS